MQQQQYTADRVHLCTVCVCRFDTTVSPTTTDEPIEVLFRIWTRVRPRNHATGGGLDAPPQMKGPIFVGGDISQRVHCKV